MRYETAVSSPNRMMAILSRGTPTASTIGFCTSWIILSMDSPALRRGGCARAGARGAPRAGAQASAVRDAQPVELDARVGVGHEDGPARHGVVERDRQLDPARLGGELHGVACLEAERLRLGRVERCRGAP